MGEVAVGLLTEDQVEELPLGAPHRQRVLVAPSALHLAGMGQEVAGHPQVIEGDVGQGDVLFEVRRPADPLAQPLGEDQVVVAQPEQIGEVRLERQRGVLCGGRRRSPRCPPARQARATPAHICPTLGDLVVGGVAVLLAEAS